MTAQATLIKDRDTTIIEAVLPAHMMQVALNGCAEEQIELRDDVAHAIAVAPAPYFQGIDELSTMRIATRIEDITATLWRQATWNTNLNALAAVASFAVLLVDEGLIKDPQNSATLTGMVLLDEIEEDPEWEVSTGVAMQWAKELLFRCRLMGFYND